MGTDKEELLKNIRYYQESLEKYSSIGNNYKVLSIIKKLKKLPIATAHLEDTGIGRTVNALRKLGGEVGDAAKALVARWKEMVVQEDVKTKEEIQKESAIENSYRSDIDANTYSEKENNYVEDKEREKGSSHRSSDETEYSDKQKNNVDKHSSIKKNVLDQRDSRDRDANKYKYERSSSEKYSSKARDDSSSNRESEEESYDEKPSKSHSKKHESYSEDEGSSSSEEEEKHNEKHKKEVKRGHSSTNSKSSDKKDRGDNKKHKSDSKMSSEKHSSKRKHCSSTSSESEEEEEHYEERHKKSESKSHKNAAEEDKSKSKHDKGKIDVKSSSSHHKLSHHKRDDKERSSKKHKYEHDRSPKRHSSKRKLSSSESEAENEEERKHRSDSDEEEDKKHNSRKSEERKSHKSKSSKSERHEEGSSKSKSREKTESKSHDHLSSKSKPTKSSSGRELEGEGSKSGSKYKEKSNHDSSDVEETREKSKSKHEKQSDTSKSHSSHSEKHEKKDKKDRDKDKASHKKDESRHPEEKQKSTKEEKDDKKEKSSASSSSKNKDGSKSSSSKEKSSSEKKNKVKLVEPVKNEKIEHGIDSESGASFAEALGMCAPVRYNKGASTSKKKSSSVPSPEKKSKSSSSSSSTFTKTEKSQPTEEKYVPNLLMEHPPEPLQLNISSLLPEITPNYKPVAFPLDTQPKRFLTPDEALSQAISNKNMRTKVYSGNKTKGGEVETLFNICVKILQDNLDAMEGTGGVPYIILKPILEKATPDQLFNMEHHNPYLIEDTDELWRLHCLKEFRTKKREEMETWREMYMRCLDEREAKLHAITANIKQSQDKSLPVRTTKLAYVDSVAKPPRNIARKQAKNGIIMDKAPSKTPAARLASLATAGEAGKVAVPNPGSRAVDRSSSSSSASAIKPKKAPLMAKTLSLFKNRFKR